jgi:PAS domain S-box-containing protein
MVDIKLLRVLAVEDNAGDARLLYEMFEEAAPRGFELTCVERLSQALPCLERQEYDLVLLDLGLPDGQGLDTFDTVNEQSRQVPIVVLTGTDDKELALEAVRRGAQDYLVKGHFDGDLVVRAASYAVERKQAEIRTQHLLQEATLFSEIAMLMASARDTSEALEEACARLASFLRVPQAGFAVLNPERLAAEVIADHRPPDSPSVLGIMLPVDGNPAMEYILEHHTPLAVADARTDPRLAPMHDVMRQRQVASILIVPVTVGGHVLGTLGFGTFERRSFADSEVDLVQRVASQMGQVVRRKQAEEAREEAYAIIRMSPAVAFVWRNDNGWPVEYVTENAEAVFGYTREEFLCGRVLYSEIVHPQDLERVAHEVMTFGQEESREELVHEPYRIIRKDGRVRWLDDRTHLRRDETGRITHYQGIVLDITERREAEEALRQSESRYRSLFENSPVALWEEDFSEVKRHLDRSQAEGVGDARAYLEENPDALRTCLGLVKVLDVNRAALNLYEADCKAALSNIMDVIVPEEMLDVFREELVAFTEGNTAFRAEGAQITLKGDKLHTQGSTVILPGHEETWSKVLVSVADITERKRAEEALRRSEERFRELAENIREVFWVFDWQLQKVLYVSPAYGGVWGRSAEALVEDYGEWTRSIHPEDLEHASDSFQRIVDTGGGESREYRIVRPDGTVRWVSDRGFAIHDNEGALYRIVGIAEDITERKQAEVQLQASLREKEALLKEVHHRVKNNLQVVSSLLELQSESIQDPQILALFRESQSRIRAMGLIHEKLYRSTNLASIEASAYLQALVDYLLSIYGSVERLISPVLLIDDIALGVDVAVSCGLIVNELVSNALKHAFPVGLGHGGIVRVELRAMAGERLALTVSDDGVGLPPALNLDGLQTLGLQLVNVLVEQLGGMMQLDTRFGTAFTITFPARSRVEPNGEVA